MIWEIAVCLLIWEPLLICTIGFVPIFVLFQIYLYFHEWSYSYFESVLDSWIYFSMIFSVFNFIFIVSLIEIYLDNWIKKLLLTYIMFATPITMLMVFRIKEIIIECEQKYSDQILKNQDLEEFVVKLFLILFVLPCVVFLIIAYILMIPVLVIAMFVSDEVYQKYKYDCKIFFGCLFICLELAFATYCIKYPTITIYMLICIIFEYLIWK